MGLYAKRVMQLSNYAINSPYAKRAKTAASTYVKKKISTALSRAIEGTRGSSPSAVRQMVRKEIYAATDKRIFQEIQASLTTKRLFTSQLIGQRIVPGTQNNARSGDRIHLRNFTTKGVLTHQGTVPATPGVAFTNKGGLAGPVTLHMFLIQTNRSDAPETYWYKDIASDGEQDYATPRGEAGPQTTSISDVNRSLNRLNTDNYRILKMMKVTAAPCMAQGDTMVDTNKEYNFSYTWPTPSLLQYNTNGTSVAPYAPTDLGKRFYYVTYLSQHDTIVDDTISNATNRSVSYTYFNDN